MFGVPKMAPCFACVEKEEGSVPAISLESKSSRFPRRELFCPWRGSVPANDDDDDEDVVGMVSLL